MYVYKRMRAGIRYTVANEERRHRETTGVDVTMFTARTVNEYTLAELETALIELERSRKLVTPDVLAIVNAQIARIEFRIEKLTDCGSD